MDLLRVELLEYLMYDDSSSSSSGSSTWDPLEDILDDGELAFELAMTSEADVSMKRYGVNATAQPSTTLTDEEFFENYRINRNLAEELASKFRASGFWNHQVGKYGSFDAYDEILMFLWFAGHNLSFRGLADHFSVAISSGHRVVRRVGAFIRSIYEVIRWPDDDEMAESAEFFQRKGLPGAIGAINLTHVEINRVSKDWDDYKNPKNKFSIQLQVICNYQKKIIHIYAGAPGSESVADVLEGSGLSDGLEAACGDYWIMGDVGYPCLKNLLVPFRGSEQELTPRQESFNELLTFGKSLVNDCFAKLRMKFPQLTHVRLKSLEDINNFVTSCCVLYNLSIDDDFLLDAAADPPDRHNSHYFLVNGDDDRLHSDEQLDDTVEGVALRDHFVSVMKMTTDEPQH